MDTRLDILEDLEAQEIEELVCLSRLLVRQTMTSTARGHALLLSGKATCIELLQLYRRARWLRRTHRPLPRIAASGGRLKT